MNIIQIGCHNCEDHVNEFIIKESDKVENFYCIDALEDAVGVAKKKYKFLKDRATFINAAIVDNDYNEDTIALYIPTDAEEMCGHASVLKKHVVDHEHNEIEEKTIQALKINDLLDKIEGKIDCLFIDAEGLDADLILSIDLTKYDIGQIFYEHRHASGVHNPGLKHSEVLSKLSSFNYELQSDVMNTLATKKYE